MRKVAFEISDNSIQASSSYAGPSVVTSNVKSIQDRVFIKCNNKSDRQCITTSRYAKLHCQLQTRKSMGLCRSAKHCFNHKILQITICNLHSKYLLSHRIKD